MNGNHPLDTRKKIPQSVQIEDLTRRLVEAEIALQALTAGQVDAVVDPISGLPILLSEAQVELRRAHDELEERVGQRTAELTLANQALQAEIAEREQAQKDLRHYAERLQVLHETDQAILAARSVQEIAESALRSAPLLLDCVWASITMFDLDLSEITLLAVSSEHKDDPASAGWLSPLADDAVMEKLSRDEVHTVENVESLSPSLAEMLRARGIQAYTNVPLIIQGQPAGSLNLGMSKPGLLTPNQVEISRELASQVAIAIQQSWLNQRLQRYAEEMEDMVVRRTAALRESEARFRTVCENSALGIALLDTDGHILTSNPALQNMMGFSEEELSGMVFHSRGHADDLEANRKLYQTLSSGKLDYYQAERRLIRKDGHERWSQLTISRVKKAKVTDPDLAILMAEDITDSKITQEALLRAERLTITGRLGASLAHDINNPLQAVLGCMGLIDEMLENGSETRRYLTVAMDELERAAGIVTHLRDLSRDGDSKKEPADVNALLERILLLTKKQCQNRGVEVVWSPMADLPLFSVAANHIQQVFLNLVLNATEAMPEGGQLQISTLLTSQPPGIDIVFTDTRTETDPEKLVQIFDPLYSPRSGDMELGLYISKKIVEEHGGRIDVDSCAGGGTQFTVWLPQ